MNILLTGTSGFLGGRIKRHLEKKHTVVPFSGDILKLGSGHFPDSGKSFDVIVHAVGLNASTCEKYPSWAYNVNVTGTHNLIVETINKKIIYLSTIHVYGYPAKGIITEESNVNPQSAYAMSHYLSEEMVLRTPDGTVMRMSNGWGLPMDYDRPSAWVVVMNKMCRDAVEKKRIQLFIHANEERNFITAEDICGTVEHLLKPECSGVYNVGGNHTVRIVDMAHRIADRCKLLLGYEPGVELPNNGSWEFYTPPRSDGYHKFELDYRIDRLKGSGFTPADNYDAEIDGLLMLIASKHKEI